MLMHELKIYINLGMCDAYFKFKLSVEKGNNCHKVNITTKDVIYHRFDSNT
jgi:hypothetical protein